jgi:nicotinate-nucleotide adenylyltransferase
LNLASAAKVPPFAAGLRIGVFGGSFNPPHEGHRAASLLALRRLRLDRIWWLVSPANPLKDPHELAPLALRVEAARKLARHPRIIVTAVEAAIDRPGSTLTALHGRAAETLAPYRLNETNGACLATAMPPAFMFLHGPRSPMSSTALREHPRVI